MNRFFVTLLLGSFFIVAGLHAIVTGGTYKAKTVREARSYGVLYLVCGLLVVVVAMLFYYQG